jgi:phosphopantothenoylcysteine decarboxylase/phosphopantothenate--cysteine ligase
VLRPQGPLKGKRVLITAGPTYEDLDPVRYIGNRSSGRMGFAIADEAARRGADVVLIAGPTSVEPPRVTELVRVRSAAEMHEAVVARAEATDVAVLAAAVADYAPADRAPQKISKGDDTFSITLRKTPDILAELGARRLSSGRGPLLVGFAAETEDVVSRAAAKRERKHVDLIVANDVSRSDAGFEVDTNAVTIVGPAGAETLPLQAKARVAAAILDRVEALLTAKRSVRL